MNNRGSIKYNKRSYMTLPTGSMSANAPMIMNISLKKEVLHHAKVAWKYVQNNGSTNDKSEVYRIYSIF